MQKIPEWLSERIPIRGYTKLVEITVHITDICKEELTNAVCLPEYFVCYYLI